MSDSSDCSSDEGLMGACDLLDQCEPSPPSSPRCEPTVVSAAPLEPRPLLRPALGEQHSLWYMPTVLCVADSARWELELAVAPPDPPNDAASVLCRGYRAMLPVATVLASSQEQVQFAQCCSWLSIWSRKGGLSRQPRMSSLSSPAKSLTLQRRASPSGMPLLFRSP